MTADLAVLGFWTGCFAMLAGLGIFLTPYAERWTRGWFGRSADTPKDKDDK